MRDEWKQEVIYKENTIYADPLRLLDLTRPVLSYQFCFEDIYREKKVNNLNSSVSNLSKNLIGIIPLKKLNFRNVFACYFHHLDLEVIEHNSAQQKINFYNTYHSYLFSYASDFYSRLRLGISLRNKRFSHKNLYEYSFSTAIKLTSWITAGYSKKISNRNYQTELIYEDLYVDMPLNFIQHYDNYVLDIGYINNFKMAFEYQKNSLQNNKNLQSQSNYFLDPKGDGESWHLSLIFKLRKKLRLFFSGRQEKLDSFGRFYYKDLQFGKITRLGLDKISYFIKVHYQLSDHHIINGSYNWINFEGTGDGHIESWPFTSTIIDLLGSRVYFKTSSNLHLDAFSLKYQYLQDYLFKFSCRLSYINIKPAGRLTTWKPLFLVFGTKDISNYFLKYESVNGLMVNIGLNYRFKKTLFDFSLGQFIPISLKMRKEVGEGSAEPSDETPKRKEADGGRFYSLTLSYMF